jgi:hypothetical protein
VFGHGKSKTPDDRFKKKKKIVYIKRGCGILLFGDLTMTKWKDHIKYHPNGHWKDNT